MNDRRSKDEVPVKMLIDGKFRFANFIKSAVKINHFLSFIYSQKWPVSEELELFNYSGSFGLFPI